MYLGLRYGHVSFSGDYASWDDARRAATGYEAAEILCRVRDSLLKVKRGEAIHEQDSILYDTVRYSWPLLAGLLWVASRSGNRLNLVDYGGSLGSSYYQNRTFLEHLDEVRWGIVEQPHFVACGKEHFEDEQLKFFLSLDHCRAEQGPTTILLSSVLPYLEKPYDFLSEVISQRFLYILIDRTPFLPWGGDRVTVQHVPSAIYPASYPAWFFNKEKFRSFFSPHYEIIAEFDSFESFSLGALQTQNKGFILKRGRNF